MLPNFVVIGTTKGGTTSLYEYLRTHPDIFLPATKEPRFFTVEDNWHRGVEWYKSNFDAAAGETAVGEVSPCYTLYPALSGVPERMARLIPNARLVYVVRQPIERMCSHYLEHVAHGRQRRPITEALWEDQRYIYGSCYTLQIERFLEYFPREQLLVVTTEAFVHVRRRLWRGYRFPRRGSKLAPPVDAARVLPYLGQADPTPASSKADELEALRADQTRPTPDRPRPCKPDPQAQDKGDRCSAAARDAGASQREVGR